MQLWRIQPFSAISVLLLYDYGVILSLAVIRLRSRSQLFQSCCPATRSRSRPVQAIINYHRLHKHLSSPPVLVMAILAMHGLYQTVILGVWEFSDTGVITYACSGRCVPHALVPRPPSHISTEFKLFRNHAWRDVKTNLRLRVLSHV